MRKFQALDQEEFQIGGGECCVWTAGSSLVKVLVVSSNIFLILSGFGLAVSPLFILIDHGGSVFNVLSNQDRVLMYLIGFWLSVVTSAFIFFTALFTGTLVAKFQTKSLLVLYAASLIGIIMSELSLGLFSYSYFSQVEYDLQKNVVFAKLDNDSSFQNAVDTIQLDMKCCGIRSYVEYGMQNGSFVEARPADDFVVPDTCCKTVTPGCGKDLHPSNIYYSGCAHALALEIKHNLLIQGALGYSLCLIQVFGLIITFLLICMKRLKREEV